VQEVYVLKSICILSEWPFYQGCMELLAYLALLSGAHLPLPLESYLANIFESTPAGPGLRPAGVARLTAAVGRPPTWACGTVPAPPAGGVLVRHSVGPCRVEFWRAPPRSLPEPRFPVDVLFRHLSIRTVAHAVALLLHEHKVIVHAQNEGVRRAHRQHGRRAQAAQGH